MGPHQILKYFENRQPEILRLISEIVEIESPSHDASRSREVADWVERQVLETGARASVERIAAVEGDHLIIRAFDSAGKPNMLLGHTDTVHPVGTKDQNPTRIDNGRFYGCGVFDMKSNIVVMIEALRYFAHSGQVPSCPVTIVLSCDEEVGSYTGRAIVEREAALSDKCLVFEPSAAGKVKTGRKGTGMFSVAAKGIPAHAGLEPDKGANAIVELARQIDNINDIADGSLGTTVNVCVIKGGTATNVIPEHAECQVDVRFSLAAEAERVSEALHSLTPIDSLVSISVTGGINRPPLERTDEVVAFYEEARDVAASFGYELGETQVGGASDGNFVAALGVPVLDGLGITGEGAHTLNEHILISDIAARSTLVTLLLM